VSGSHSLLFCVCVAVFASTAANAQSPPDPPGAAALSSRAASPAFGDTLIDVSLRFTETARQSLGVSPDTDVPAEMSFADADGRARAFDVSVHIKGGAGSKRSLRSKPAFKVKLHHGDRFYGLEHLTFNNMVQDATLLHEALGYQVYAAAGAPAAATGYVRLTIDDQAYGLYMNVETPDTAFLMRAFGDDSGILYEGAYGADLGKFELHEGLDADRATLAAFIDAVDRPDNGVFYGTPPLLDTGAFLGMMAAEALLGDWDSYYRSNNYRIYWNPSASQWTFIPTGIDQAFTGTTVFGATGLLFKKCLTSERCTSDYAQHVRDVAARFDSLELPAKMDALLLIIHAAAESDTRKGTNASTTARAQEKLRNFIAARPAAVRAAVACLDETPDAVTEACTTELAPLLRERPTARH